MEIIQILKIQTLAAILCGAALCVLPLSAQSQEQAPASIHAKIINSLVEKYGARLIHSHYMEKNCEPVVWPGWEGYPTIKCRYSVTDKANHNTKEAEVVMLNASPKTVATWAVTAAIDAGSTRPAVDAGKIIQHIIGQSGGQFPVAGVVYEDMEGDGYFDTFCFRNGVTTRVAGVKHRTTATLTKAEIQASLTAPIEHVYTYARIASTTPDQYRAAGGTAAVGTNAERTKVWPKVVGELYRKAWNSPRNELISAWAKANLAKQ